MRPPGASLFDRRAQEKRISFADGGVVPRGWPGAGNPAGSQVPLRIVLRFGRGRQSLTGTRSGPEPRTAHFPTVEPVLLDDGTTGSCATRIPLRGGSAALISNDRRV